MRPKFSPKRNSKSRHALISRWHQHELHWQSSSTFSHPIPILSFILPQVDALLQRGFPEPMLRALLTAFASTNAIAVDLTSVAQSASLYADERANWSGGGNTSLVAAPSTLPLPPHQTVIELLAVACSVALKMPVRVVRCTPQTRPRDLFYANLQQPSQSAHASSTSFDTLLRLASSSMSAAGRDAEEFSRLVQSHFAARDTLLTSLVSEENESNYSDRVGDGTGNAGNAPSASPPPFLRFRSQVAAAAAAAATSPTNGVGHAHRRMESDSFAQSSSSRFTSAGLHRGDAGSLSADGVNQQPPQLVTPLFYRDTSQRVNMPMSPPLALTLTRSQHSEASQQQPQQTQPRAMLDSFAILNAAMAATSLMMNQISLAKKPTLPDSSPRAFAPMPPGGGLPRPPSATLSSSPVSSHLSSSPHRKRDDIEGQLAHENFALDHEPSPPPPLTDDEQHEAEAAAASSPSPSDMVQSPSRGKLFRFGGVETAPSGESLQTPTSRNLSMAGNAAPLAGSAEPATISAHRANMNFASPPPVQQPSSSSQHWNHAPDATNASLPLPPAVDQLDGPLFANVCIFEDFHLAPAAIRTIILEV
jgi:hypothetical protein